ncbi:A24 family peptidase [Halomonas chromatireducens]|uniref:Type IV leader peptidase family protein n=1 Tax=Halomonas chromatireducens TaxID=507626 RepID=A0A120JWP3_9GAMM|nr:A24 family peptidase [Halomonas chromatireducens]AMD02291.1 Type IV leader peptidase family protein [Halomonas chromatireducens]
MRHELLLIPCLLLAWIAAGWDLRIRRIPNRLVLAGTVMGLLLQGVLVGTGGFLAAILGLLVGMAILMPGYLMGFTGAGDAKLMAAVGTFLGPVGVLQAGLMSIVVGGIVGMVFATSALFRRQSVSPWSRYGLMAKTLLYTGRPLYIAPKEGEVMGSKFPFAVSIAIGATGWMIWQWPLAFG